ncbi:hypothetical protein BDZ45DRAFT_749327 [Acephala macrosclerotiorum]|nr:hypothetical protein BDZ45DRAFT_749327 [Acephala macrosclerotiorum]
MSVSASLMSDPRHKAAASSNATSVIRVGEEGEEEEKMLRYETVYAIIELPPELHRQIFEYLHRYDNDFWEQPAHTSTRYTRETTTRIHSFILPPPIAGRPRKYHGIILIGFEHDIERIYDSASSALNEGYMKIISDWLILHSRWGPHSNTSNLTDLVAWDSFITSMSWSRGRLQKVVLGLVYNVYSTKVFLQEH